MKILKSVFLIPLFILLTLDVSGQSEDNLDVIYLKGGEFLFGNLIEDKKDATLWQLTDGTQIIINDNRIRSIESKKKNIQYLKKGQQKKIRGLYGNILVGGFVNNNIEVNSQATLHLSMGYHLNKRLAVGVGGGLDLYDNRHFIWPAFVEVTGNLFDSSYLPFYKLTLGYSYLNQSAISDPTRSLEGGILVQPSLGIKFLSRSGIAWIFEFGYRIQRYDEVILGRDAPRKWARKQMVIRTGIEF
jgi:hypothetical protein